MQLLSARIILMPQSTSWSAPFQCPELTVLDDWIDYNGHMNVAWYVAAFDQGVDALFDALGIGEDYVSERGLSCFTGEIRVKYLNELKRGEAFSTSIQLLDWDSKRLHFFMTMRGTEDNTVAATLEQLAIHVDMNERRSAAFPDDVAARIETLMTAHQALPAPEGLDRAIGIRRR